MPATYSQISSLTLSSAGTIDLTSIPQIYTDISIVLTGYTVSDSQVILIRCNGDTSSSWTAGQMSGYGAAGATLGFFAASTSTPFLTSNYIGWSNVSSERSMITIDLMNYTNTNMYKPVQARFGTAKMTTNAQGTGLFVGTYLSTNAITSVQLLPYTGNFGIGTTCDVYGIKAA